MSAPDAWQIKAGALETPLIMGIVNVTPDSFSDGGRYVGHSAVEHGLSLIAAGADIVDVGGESTRPGAEPVEETEEIRRIHDVVGRLAEAGATVSIDTMKPGVARVALDVGARIVNDVGGLADEAMRTVVAEHSAGVVIMHMQGEPRTMQIDPTYSNVVTDVARFLTDRTEIAIASGISLEAIVLDPGIGFGKSVEHNLSLLRQLPRLAELGQPILVGASRKRFLGTILGIEAPDERDRATSILTAMVLERGAGVVRVHDVAGSREALSLVRAIVGGREGNS